MRPRYTIKLSVMDREGTDAWHMAVDSDEFPLFSERFVEDIRSPSQLGFSVMPFDTVVSALKKREFRRDFLLSAAKTLAARLADYIEDKEGWHGERRRETIKEVEARKFLRAQIAHNNPNYQTPPTENETRGIRGTDSE